VKGVNATDSTEKVRYLRSKTQHLKLSARENHFNIEFFNTIGQERAFAVTGNRDSI